MHMYVYMCMCINIVCIIYGTSTVYSSQNVIHSVSVKSHGRNGMMIMMMMMLVVIMVTMFLSLFGGHDDL